MRTPQSVLLWVAALAGSFCAQAYELTGSAWANGNIVMQLQLGGLGRTLSDGATTWSTPAQAALAEWNTYITRSRFTYVDPSSVAKANNNSYNNVYFAAQYGNSDFGDGVLAITLRWTVPINNGTYSRISEADVIFNSADYTWDSYRGKRGTRTQPDFQRVAIHEFGHVLGLDHPDEASPPQAVEAVMNSRVSDTDSLTADDIAGAKVLYDPQAQPAITEQPPATRLVIAGEPFSLTYSASGPPFTEGWWYSRSDTSPTTDLLNGDGNPWEGSTYTVAAADPADTGYYRGVAANIVGYATTGTAHVTVQNPPGMATAYLANISTRGFVGTGDSILIAGFVITGSTPKTVLVRGIGPTLSSQGVSRPLADPKITLFNKSGTAIATNDDWGNDPLLAATFLRTGAFPLSGNSKDAAMLVTLAPGQYTVHVSGVNNTTGVSLVEVYDVDESPEASLTHKLINISTRGYVGIGDEILIAGFVIKDGPKRVLLRAAGPKLTSQGVSGVNTDPNLRLFRGSEQIADNDDWYYSNQTPLLPGLFSQVGAFAFDNESYDSALVITLKPGPYTVLIEGRNDETGIALVEVYELP